MDLGADPGHHRGMTNELEKQTPIDQHRRGVDARLSRGIIVVVRVGLGFLWIQNVGWEERS